MGGGGGGGRATPPPPPPPAATSPSAAAAAAFVAAVTAVAAVAAVAAPLPPPAAAVVAADTPVAPVGRRRRRRRRAHRRWQAERQARLDLEPRHHSERLLDPHLRVDRVIRQPQVRVGGRVLPPPRVLWRGVQGAARTRDGGRGGCGSVGGSWSVVPRRGPPSRGNGTPHTVDRSRPRRVTCRRRRRGGRRRPPRRPRRRRLRARWGRGRGGGVAVVVKRDGREKLAQRAQGWSHSGCGEWQWGGHTRAQRRGGGGEVNSGERGVTSRTSEPAAAELQSEP
ncbi:hypothetical protein I4F81_007378 [Pyropia yezoensis]|uniref:Uncharacterized protein n=1 Tax=Pyropia yezoensis TaxID=2788 RepID=A0ACC3C3F8_PYRYE|nr:hypothetical protein I4F81_007378 [Neopyropia yezoensis]